MELDTEYPLTR